MENSQVTAKKKTVVKAVKVIMALLLMVAIAFAAALIVHDSDRAVPAFTLSDGLSAYDLAVQNGYTSFRQDCRSTELWQAGNLLRKIFKTVIRIQKIC